MTVLYNWSRYRSNSNQVATGNYTWTKYSCSSSNTATSNYYWNKYNCITSSYSYKTGRYYITVRSHSDGLSRTYYGSSYNDAWNYIALNTSYSNSNSTLVSHGWEYASRPSYSKGSLVSTTTGSYSYKTHGARNSDGYWWERGNQIYSTSYSRGSYVSSTSGGYNRKKENLNEQNSFR